MEAVAVPRAENEPLSLCPNHDYLYRCEEKTYRKKYSKPSGINAAWAIEDIKEYALGQSDLGPTYGPEGEAP